MLTEIEKVVRLARRGYSNVNIAYAMEITTGRVAALKAHATRKGLWGENSKTSKKAQRTEKPITESFPLGTLKITKPGNLKIFRDENSITISW